MNDTLSINQTHYDDGEAEYDAVDWPYQLVDDEGEIIALFGHKQEAEHVLALLRANPFPTQAGGQ